MTYVPRSERINERALLQNFMIFLCRKENALLMDTNLNLKSLSLTLIGYYVITALRDCECCLHGAQLGLSFYYLMPLGLYYRFHYVQT